MKEPIIVSYFTRDTLYELEAENLRLSCEAFGLSHFLHPIKGSDSWEVNCSIKANFLIDCFHAFKRPLIWIDADGEVVQKPELLLKPPGNFSFLVHDELPLTHHSKAMSSTLYFNDTEESLTFLKSWAEKCEKNPYEWDQKHLATTFFERPNWKGFFPLPKNYCAIYDRNIPDPVIHHYQASRLIKKFINQECVSFFDFKTISASEWRQLRIEFYESVKEPLSWNE